MMVAKEIVRLKREYVLKVQMPVLTNLNLLADMGLTFTDQAYALNVINLNVKAKAQLTGDGNGGWLKVQVLVTGHCN